MTVTATAKYAVIETENYATTAESVPCLFFFWPCFFLFMIEGERVYLSVFAFLEGLY